MRPLTLEQVTDWTEGRLLTGNPAAVVNLVSTDSRGALAGALFIPLIGERFDGHAFVPQAFAQGAAATLWSGLPTALPSPCPAAIAVDDTLHALQRLATRYRASLAPFVAVGVTGSNGKTSTKDFLASVLEQRFRVQATRGNLNNHIGVPLTVLSVGPEHTAGIFEMGMNHFGEIAPLCAVAQPQIGVITNIGEAHVEFLGSREGIALEKGRLVEAIGADGCAVLNADDDFTPALAARTSARVLTAGLTRGEVRAERIEGSDFNLVSEMFRIAPLRCSLSVPGRHMIGNALLAAAVGLYLGLSAEQVKAGLEGARLQGGRLQRREAGGLHFLDDSYNANPDSMRAALVTLVSQAVRGRHLAVLGRMGELGPHSEAGHRDVGEAARLAPVDFLITVGEDESRLIHEAFGDAGKSRHFITHADAADWLARQASPDDLILVKGSRSATMEKVMTALAECDPAPVH